MSARLDARALFAAGLALVASAGGARAQVGYTPEQSPFRDLEYKQEVTVIGGVLRAHKDPAGVAPTSGPLLGVRYGLTLTGPLFLKAEVAGVTSDRTVLDPSRPAATRAVGTKNTTLLLADVGLGMALTGSRSWHHLVPEVSAGGGIVTDFNQSVDVGGYRFGTPFALTLGSGIRWVPGGRWQVRADLTDRLYRISYPQSYYRSANNEPAVLDAGQSKSFWTHNPTLTLGLSYLFDR